MLFSSRSIRNRRPKSDYSPERTDGVHLLRVPDTNSLWLATMLSAPMRSSNDGYPVTEPTAVATAEVGFGVSSPTRCVFGHRLQSAETGYRVAAIEPPSSARTRRSPPLSAQPGPVILISRRRVASAEARGTSYDCS